MPPTPPSESTPARPKEAETSTATSLVGTVPSESGGEVSVLTSRGTRERHPADAIRAYDFRQSSFLTPSELRRIRLRHDQFVRALAARLGIFLRLEFTVQLAKLQVAGYQKFIEALPSPIHMTLFKTEPLKGAGLLVIPPRLGLSLVDRLLGGAGKMSETGRDLTEIEIVLLDQVAMLVLGEWCNHWPEMRELRPAVISHENNCRFLPATAPDAAMLTVTLEAGVGDQLEPIQIVFPYATVEPLVRLVCPPILASPDAAARPARCKWNAEFNDMLVPAVAEWRGLKLSAGDVTRLKSGDVLMLDPACAGQVQLRLSHLPKFVGRPGTRGGKWAVELTGPAAT